MKCFKTPFSSSVLRKGGGGKSIPIGGWPTSSFKGREGIESKGRPLDPGGKKKKNALRGPAKGGRSKRLALSGKKGDDQHARGEGGFLGRQREPI